MPTRYVVRAADGTEVYRSVFSVICKRIDWFDGTEFLGRCNEGHIAPTLNIVRTLHTEHTVHNMCTVHILCTV